MLKKAILITGSSSGIGAALARQLAAPDVGLFLHARHSKERLEAVAAEVRAKGATVEFMLGDMAEQGVCETLVEKTVSAFGRLDHLVANAGFPMMKSFSEGTAEDIEYAFRSNLFSLFAMAKAAEAELVKSDQGRIVALGSFTSHVFRTDMPQFPMSAASKGGVETAVRSLSLAFAKSNVTVNGIIPGYIQKDVGTSDGLSVEKLKQLQDLIPLSRLGQNDEVAATIAFLLSPAAGYITGQNIHVNGGLI